MLLACGVGEDSSESLGLQGDQVKWSEVTQLCLTLWDPVDCSLPGSSVHGIFQARITGMGCHFLLQEIFPTQGLNPGHCRQMLYCLSHQGSPKEINPVIQHQVWRIKHHELISDKEPQKGHRHARILERSYLWVTTRQLLWVGKRLEAGCTGQKWPWVWWES